MPRPRDEDVPKTYWAFVPDPLPTEPTSTMKSVSDAGPAAMAVACLNAAVSLLLNPHLLLRPIIRREAISTSALEGTDAEFDEVLEFGFLGGSSDVAWAERDSERRTTN